MNPSSFSTANSRSPNTVTSDATCMSRRATSLDGGETIGDTVPSACTSRGSREISGSNRFCVFPPPDWVKENTEIPEDVKIGNGTGKARVAYTTDLPPGSFHGDLSKSGAFARTRIVYDPEHLPSVKNYLKAEGFRKELDRKICLWINLDDIPRLPNDHRFDLNDPAQFESIESALRSDLGDIIENNSQATYENYTKVLARKTNGEEIASDYFDVKYYSFNDYLRLHPRKWKETRYPKTGDPSQCPPQTDKEDISADTKASEVGKRVSPDTDNETVNSGVKKMTVRELAKL